MSIIAFSVSCELMLLKRRGRVDRGQKTRGESGGRGEKKGVKGKVKSQRSELVSITSMTVSIF